MDNLFEYNRKGEKAELIIKDYSGAKIDTFKWSINDKNLEKKIYSIVKRKYGMFKPEAPPLDSDLNWLKKS